MYRDIKPTLLCLLATLAIDLSLFAPPAAAELSISYCSSQNTGSSNDDLVHIYQSNGWCHDQCVDNYAFAVVKDTSCWCADYIPSEQEDTGECNEDCPGFPAEKCGNKDKNLYGYIALDKRPSGTQAASQPASTERSAPPSPVSSKAPETVVETVTASAPVVTVTPSAAPKTSAAQSSPAPTTMRTIASSSEPTETFVPTPVTSVQTLTVSGIVVTQTVTSMSTPPPAMTESPKGKKNVGAIAGGAVGGTFGLAALIAVVVLVLRRRRKDREQETGADGSNVRRNASTLSKVGLLREKPILAPIVTQPRRNSRHMDTESSSPMSNSDRRNSRHLVYDQRLNPSAIMTMDNMSRSSLVTMEDNRDYGRTVTLNVRNPDPDRSNQ